MSEFRVDTHIFRELGALLVGRDSTALAELIKNCYDADATHVYVRGENLHDSNFSRVVVADNGNGMTRREFERGFLTIASRSKSEVARFSPVYSRRFTGAKGIGRLAAHKLAHVLDIESLPNTQLSPAGSKSTGVRATLDWDVIESYVHLDEISGALPVLAISRSKSALETPHGTTITLTRLRRAWTERDLASFVSEVQGYEPPADVFGPDQPDHYSAPLHRRGIRVRGSENGRGAAKSAKPFTIHLEGDFDRGEDFAPQPGAAAQYVLEIDSSPKGLVYGIARTDAMNRTLPEELRGPIPTVTLAALTDGPYFQARVFVRAGAKASWPRSATGVRVYMEGFRVLPYGEPGNDWLGTDSQYTQRGRELVSLGDKLSTDALFGTATRDEGLSTLPATGYIGGVFLTEESSGGLQMLVNREGFVPGPPLEALTTAVRRGIDYVTRIRARDVAARKRTGTRRNRNIVTASRSQALAERTQKLSTLVADVNRAVESGDSVSIRSSVQELATLSGEVAGVTDDLLDELNMIRVLASVGSQLSAFVHELNGLLAVTSATQQQLKFAREKMPPRESRTVARVSTMLDELRRGLDRQASYLVDVTSSDARRRRSVQRVRDRVDAVYRMLGVTAQRRRVRLEIDVDEAVRTRPMFRAELTAILTNLLTNAVKAATPDDALAAHDARNRVRASSDTDPDTDTDTDPDTDTGPGPGPDGSWGEVKVQASEDADGTTILIMNTGVAVDVSQSDKWFDPYATTTVETDPVLGQGTGLGLTITRSLVAENAGTVEFVDPVDGFASCVRLFFPPRRRR